MKRFLAITILVFIISAGVSAQNYSTSLGLRGGLSNGLTLKHFISEDKALEGIFSSRWRGFNLTGLYEVHAPAFGAEKLQWYYGLGGHAGFWSGYDKHPWFDDNEPYTVIGVDAIIGLEYTFSEIPFNISLDYKPAFNLVGYFGPWVDAGAFSIRYNIK